MEWQPIETAPKGERLILVRRANGDNFQGVFVAYWSPHDADWLYSVGRSTGELSDWMPLPAPPEAAP